MALVLIPIGQEEREKTWPTSKDENITCRYTYFYFLASDLGVAWNLRWYLSSDPLKEVTYDHIKQSFPNETPRFGLWRRFSLLIVLGVVIGGMILGF